MQKNLLAEPNSNNEKSNIFFSCVNSLIDFESRFPHKILAVCYMILSCILFVMAAFLTKINSDVPPGQLVFNRAIYEMILSFFTIYIQNGKIYTSTASTNKLLLIAGVTGGLNMTMYFRAIYYLPISICAVIFMLNPLWIGLVTSFNERKFDKWMFGVLVMSLIGMVLIVKPGFRRDDKNKDNAMLFYAGVLLAFMTSILASISFFAIRGLQGKIQTATIVLYFDFAMIICSATSEKCFNV